MKKFFYLVFFVTLLGSDVMASEEDRILDHLISADEFKEEEIESRRNLSIGSLHLLRQRLEKADNAWDAGRIINLSANKLVQFKGELDAGFFASFVDLMVKKSKEFPDGISGHYRNIKLVDPRSAELLIPVMLESDDPLTRMMAEKIATERKQKNAPRQEPPTQSPSVSTPPETSSPPSKKAPEPMKSPQATQTPVEESLPSPTRWPLVAVVVVAALGLLWLWLKKRK